MSNSLLVERGLLLTEGRVSSSERNIGRLLDFFGIHWSAQSVNTFMRSCEASQDTSNWRVFCSGETFLQIDAYLKKSSATSEWWREKVHSAFVYCDPGGAAARKLASSVANGLTVITHTPHGYEFFRVADDERLCGVMAGLQIKSVVSPWALFGGAFGHGTKKIVSTGEGASCIWTQYDTVPLFISASDEIIDLDRELPRGIFDIREHVLTALPVSLYVRWAFTDRWQTVKTSACLIIDDPVLKHSYGYVHFPELLSLMRQHQFSTNVAFIPWNWRRSDREIANLFLHNPQYYSISVHGCDHTRAEYGNSDTSALYAKTRRGLARMADHEKQTGIRHNRVMIFPQGVFSAAAMAVLKQTELIAAMNNDTLSRDRPAPSITIADVWDVAVMKYADYPLFTRRYPWEGIENFAFDALLGKPALVTIHHESCRDRCQLVDFVERLNVSGVAPIWRDLGEIARQSYRWRLLDQEVVGVEMYATELLLENYSNLEQNFRVRRRESSPSSIKDVRIGPNSVQWETTNSGVTFNTCLGPGQSALVKITFETFEKEGAESLGALGEARVMLRRYLCELRDNYVTKGRMIFASAMGRKDQQWS